MSIEQPNELLIESGRELGARFLANAFNDSESPEQTTNQVFVLQIAAVSILATIAMNAEINQGVDPMALLQQYVENLKNEYLYMKKELAEGNLERFNIDPRESAEKPIAPVVSILNPKHH